MKNPYTVLQVPTTAKDNEIKTAYIQKVKEYSPERSPEKFMEIRDAYEKIATLKKRIQYRLFTVEDIEPKAIMDIFLKFEKRNRIQPQELIGTMLKKYQQSKNNTD